MSKKLHLFAAALAAAGCLAAGPPTALAQTRPVVTTLGPDFPIIGVGGILSAEQAADTRAAGADLLQLYTGLIYRGPALIREVLDIVR